MPSSRRAFVGHLGVLAVAGAAPGALGRLVRADDSVAAPVPAAPAASPAMPFTISLAQWSLHRALRAGTLDPLDFPRAAKRDYGIDAVEYVNSFLMRGAPEDGAGRDTRPREEAWIADLRGRCAGEGVSSVLIMCDGLGNLGDADAAARQAAVDRHKPWAEVAKGFGCHSIRVNAASSGTWAEQRDRAAAGLRALCEFADGLGLNVIVENHGGLSSNGAWLAETIRAVGHPRAGTLPDFGNFDLGDGTRYDRYLGVTEMMPFAKAVSAKSHDFDAAGNETGTDYRKMLAIVLAAGYRGRIGIEYEGDRLSEPEGIRATKSLLERVAGGR